MNCIIDSSSLIYFGKIKLLEKLIKLKGEKIIPKRVYDEVILKGIERDEPEVNYINELIKNKVFNVEEAKIIREFELLSGADSEVIELAKEKNSMAIIDDSYAKSIADSLNIKCHGSVYLILKLIEQEVITKEEAINYIDKMIEFGFYLSVTKYKEIVNIIEKQ